MTCEPLRIGDVTGFACSRGQRGKRCKQCGRPATRLCDYPLSGAKAGKTCGAPMCDRCATRIDVTLDGSSVDYCRVHADLHKKQEPTPTRTRGKRRGNRGAP